MKRKQTEQPSGSGNGGEAQPSQETTGAYFGLILGATQQEGENVEQQVWLTWFQENREPAEQLRQYLLEHIPKYYPGELPAEITSPVPDDIQAFYSAFVIIGQWQQFLHKEMSERESEKDAPVETTTTETTKVQVPRSQSAPSEIYASLKPYLKF